MVLVPTKHHEIGVDAITRPTTGQFDSAQSTFSRGKLNVIIYKHSPVKVSVLPITDNPQRVVVFREAGRNGLRIFYYDDDLEHVYIAVHQSFIRLHRDQLYQVHKGLRKFTKKPRQGPFKPPGKQFTEYPPPKEKAANTEN